MADRLERWCDASHSLAQFEHPLAVIAQQLGRMDCELDAEWARYSGLDEKQREADGEIQAFNRILTHSYLWVLGAYELVRTMESLAKLLGDESADRRQQIQAVKQDFARLRMPLAKLEPASSHETDYAIALPHWYPDRGIAWAVADGVYISRADLADDLLALLEALDTGQVTS